jgi:hypothetical protein
MKIARLAQNALKGKAAKVVLGVIGFMIIVTLLSYGFHKSISGVARLQLIDIRDNRLEEAYNMTSTAFQDQTSLAAFQSFVDHYPILTTFKKMQFIETRMDGDDGYLYGKLEDSEGTKSTIEFQFVKEDREWKIKALRLAPAGSEEDEPVADKTGASIHSIFVNDTANAKGYTEKGKTSIPKTAPTIFVTVQIIAPTADISASATLIESSSDSRIGPSTGEINKTGNVLKAFSFTRDKNLWPTGEYQVEISLSTGAKKMAKFSVH